MDFTVLVALLGRYGRLILPDLGAFLVSDFEGGYNAANVTFSPFLRYNDGKLEQYLESDYAQTVSQARQSVQDIVRSIRQMLETTGVCFIPNLGELRQDESGQITFAALFSSPSPIVQSQQEDATSFDIPLIDELATAPAPVGEFTISDGSFAPRESLDTTSSIEVTTQTEGDFSLDGAIAGVTQVSAPSEHLPLVEITLDAEGGAQGGESFVVVEPQQQDSGYPVDDCLHALESYKTATVSSPPVVDSDSGSVANEGDNEEVAPAAQEVQIQPSAEEEASVTSSESSSSHIQMVMNGVKSTRTVRSVAATESLDTPWVVPQSIPQKHRSYMGVMWAAILIVVVSLLLIDWLWLQQVTPRFVALLEDQGILLRGQPSVDIQPQEAAQVVVATPSASIPANSAAGAVGELEKEWQRRVATEEGSTAQPTGTGDAGVSVATQGAIAGASSNVTAGSSANTSSNALSHTASSSRTATAVDARERFMPATSAGAFHLVLGSFRDADNATTYAARLQKAGFRTTILDQASGMHAVVVGSYTTRREAARALDDIRGRYPQAWVLER